MRVSRTRFLAPPCAQDCTAFKPTISPTNSADEPDFEGLVIERHAHRSLFRRVLGLRASLSACDAAYVALAEALAAPMLTCDDKLGRVHRHKARIEVVPVDS